MKDGFIKVSAVSVPVAVGDVESNKNSIAEAMKAEFKRHTKVCVFSELVLTGATCEDLFYQETLTSAALDALRELIKLSRSHDTLCFVGLPWVHEGNVFDAAAAFQDGELLAVITKTYTSDFTPGPDEVLLTDYEDTQVPFGSNILLKCPEVPELTVACEIGDDFYAPFPVSLSHVQAGATLIVHPDAKPYQAGGMDTDVMSILAHTDRTLCAYAHASAGEGESTTDYVYASHNMISECGLLLDETEALYIDTASTEIDVKAIWAQRKKSGFFDVPLDDDYVEVDFDLKIEKTKITRYVDGLPFVPDEEDFQSLEDIIGIQVAGLRGRLSAIGCEKVILGLSGGLDSTMALIVAALTMDSMGLPRKNIHTVTMPCFGTTDRTYNNACTLAGLFGTRLSEINIADAVKVHLDNIGHKMSDHNTAYENAQARERTQVLMDISNDEGSIVIGTGDLSELALGWATYNGDHMSNYAVNASVPKTLMRYLIRYYAAICENKKITEVLLDVLDTPVSPELLPPSKGRIKQKTEDIIGPYELHDFFLYYMMVYGFGPKKIVRLAKIAWGDEYSDEVILNWAKTFYKRFFSQQFKRSCMPDGPKATPVSLSPRKGLSMPSDAKVKMWMKELEI